MRPVAADVARSRCSCFRSLSTLLVARGLCVCVRVFGTRKDRAKAAEPIASRFEGRFMWTQ